MATSRAGLPPEYEADINAADLNRQLAQVMLQRGLQPVQGSMVGKHYVRTNPMQHLAQMLNVWSGRTGLEAAVQQSGEVKRRAAADESAERAGIVGHLNPKTVPFLSADAGGDVEAAATTPPDPMAAERAALGARFPGNQELAKILMENRLKAFQTGATGATMPSVVAGAQAGGDPRQLQGAWGGAPQSVTIGGNPAVVTYDPRSNEPSVKFAPKETVKIDNNIAGAKPINTELWKQKAKQLEESQSAVRQALPHLQPMKEALTILESGALNTGTAAEQITAIQKMGKLFGLDVPVEAANTELLLSKVVPMVGQMVKMFGAGTAISNADLEFAKQSAALPVRDIRAGQEIIRAGIRGILRAAGDHNAFVEQASQSADATSGLTPENVKMFNQPFQFDTNGIQDPFVPYDPETARQRGAPVPTTPEPRRIPWGKR